MVADTLFEVIGERLCKSQRYAVRHHGDIGSAVFADFDGSVGGLAAYGDDVSTAAVKKGRVNVCDVHSGDERNATKFWYESVIWRFAMHEVE